MKKLEDKLGKFGIMPGLERTRSLCSALGNPQDKLKVILVTGTNGKGSVTAALASILNAAGHKTGAYFSPHLVRYNERIKIGDSEIPNSDYERYENEVLALHENGMEMTVFEAMTTIAFKYFADQGCEYAVMEIGMGGSYDATNIANEQVAIVTNVDLDHTEYLGTTVDEIAKDKAGIIKNPQGLVITGCVGAALEEIQKRCNEVHSTLVPKPKTITKQMMANGVVFDYYGKQTLNEMFFPLTGSHQIDNAALAVAAAEALGIAENAIRMGLSKTKHRGRLEIISKQPLVVVDGAHNAHGTKAMIDAIGVFPHEKLVCVFTALKDKKWKEMLAIIAPHCDYIIVNQLGMDRAESADAIAEEAVRYTGTHVVKDIRKSIGAAKRKAGKNGMVLVCGSLYMIGEALVSETGPKTIR